jgi:hypothetical protein
MEAKQIWLLHVSVVSYLSELTNLVYLNVDRLISVAFLKHPCKEHWCHTKAKFFHGEEIRWRNNVILCMS